GGGGAAQPARARRVLPAPGGAPRAAGCARRRRALRALAGRGGGGGARGQVPAGRARAPDPRAADRGGGRGEREHARQEHVLPPQAAFGPGHPSPPRLRAPVFERFTEEARRLIFFARYEGGRFGAPAIDTEHLLLGLLREGKGRASTLLASRGIPFSSLRIEVESSVTRLSPGSTTVEIPLSSAARRALEIAVEEAGRGEVG